VLHPVLLDGALQSSIGLMRDPSGRPDHLSLPVAMASVRIVAPCTEKMFAWVRHATDHRDAGPSIKLDIDVCDADGNICVQMRDVSYDRGTRPVVAVITAPSLETKAEEQNIVLTTPAFARAGVSKPTIVLV
jgi:hypothetical protein